MSLTLTFEVLGSPAMELNDVRLPKRFWAKVRLDPSTGCWLWTAGKDWDGYGMFWIDGATVRAPGVAFKALRGPVPAGLQIDHLCRVRACVNPLHLEAVSGRTNTLRGETLPAENLRKTHCINGHEFTGTNLGMRKGRAGRYCKICSQVYGSRSRARGRIEDRRRAAAQCIRCGIAVTPPHSECDRHLEIHRLRVRKRRARIRGVAG